MTAAELKLTQDVNEEEFSIPLCIEDIISICREYNMLGSQIQNQVSNILEMGVSQAIKTNRVKREALPHIRNFLKCINSNPYFGEAASEAYDCIYLIEEYEEQNIIRRSN